MLSKMDLLKLKLKIEGMRGIGLVILSSSHGYVMRKVRKTKNQDYLFLESVPFSFSFLQSLYPNLFSQIEYNRSLILTYSVTDGMYSCSFLEQNKECSFVNFCFQNDYFEDVFTVGDAYFSRMNPFSFARTISNYETK